MLKNMLYYAWLYEYIWNGAKFELEIMFITSFSWKIGDDINVERQHVESSLLFSIIIKPIRENLLKYLFSVNMSAHPTFCCRNCHVLILLSYSNDYLFFDSLFASAFTYGFLIILCWFFSTTTKDIRLLSIVYPINVVCFSKTGSGRRCSIKGQSIN